MNMTAVIDKFKSSMNALNRETMTSGILEDLYHTDVRFIDPVHEHHGIDHVKDYFTSLYENITYIAFQFTSESVFENKITLEWVMECGHPKLNSGKRYQVNGCSILEIQDGKVIWQRDYYDLGQMLYERVPLLGKLIKKLKARLQ